MARQIKLTYADGTTQTARLSMKAMCKAEEHAIKEGWGNAQQSPMRITLYAAYAALRMAGETAEPFDAWLERVDDMDESTEGDTDPLQD